LGWLNRRGSEPTVCTGGIVVVVMQPVNTWTRTEGESMGLSTA